MELKTTLSNDMKAAMKARDFLRLNALRMLLAEIQKREIDKKAALDEPEILKTISSLLKQRNDSIEAFQKGGRQDLVDKEKMEATILQAYLPAPLSQSEVEVIVRMAIEETGATSQGDIGRVMKIAMAKAEGRVDGRVINELARTLLCQPH